MPLWVFDIHPVPASRPRVSRYGTYYGKNYTRFRKAADLVVPKTVGKHRPYDADTSLAVSILIQVPKPKSGTDKKWPRGDVDNFAKGILDACNGVVWIDDDSITKLIVKKVWGDPKIIMKVKVLEQ